MNIDDYAKSARFSLSDDERGFISSRAEDFKKSFEAIKSINPENITPMYTVLNEKNILREDTANKFISRDILLSFAPEQYGGYFQVPKAID